MWKSNGIDFKEKENDYKLRRMAMTMFVNGDFNPKGVRQPQRGTTEHIENAMPVLDVKHQQVLKFSSTKGTEYLSEVNKSNVIPARVKADENGNEMLALAGINNSSFAYSSDPQGIKDFDNQLAQVFTGGNVTAFMHSPEMRIMDQLFGIA